MRIFNISDLLPISSHSQNTGKMSIGKSLLTGNSIEGSNADIETFYNLKEPDYGGGISR